MECGRMNDVKKTLKQLCDLLPYHEGDKFKIIEECAVALEKQTPVEVLMKEEIKGQEDLHEGRCPCCHRLIYEFESSRDYNARPYCRYCLQLLNWSVGE